MFSWSMPLFRLFGIPVRLHFTFFLLLGLVVLGSLGEPTADGGTDTTGLIANVALLLMLYAIVTCHEFGHALVVKKFGGEVIDIVLWPLGGVARMRRMPEKPGHEILVAIAGPAVNFAFFGIAILAAGFTAESFSLAGAGEMLALAGSYVPMTGEYVEGMFAIASVHEFFIVFGTINLAIGLFNLLPAFPMDGGRVLRGVLGFGLPFEQATRTAVSVGRVLAFAMVGLGVWSMFSSDSRGFMFVLIGLFILYASSSEGRQVVRRSLLRGVRAADAMFTSPRVVSPADSLTTLLDLALHANQDGFPVLWQEQVVGWISRGNILERVAGTGNGATGNAQAALAKAAGMPMPPPGYEPRAADLMNRQFPWVRPDDSLERVTPMLQSVDSGMVPVIHENGRLLGLLGTSQIAALLHLRSLRMMATRSSTS